MYATNFTTRTSLRKFTTEVGYNSTNMQTAPQYVCNIDWHYKLNNLSATNMVSEFTLTIMGVMSRFIPNKIITCNDKDPPWITPEIKMAIKHKHRVYNKYVRRVEGVDLMNVIMYGLFEMTPKK